MDEIERERLRKTGDEGERAPSTGDIQRMLSSLELVLPQLFNAGCLCSTTPA